MSSLETNREYYEADSPARRDYWRYMAAPRQRVSRVCREISRIAPSSVVDLGCGDGSLLGEIGRRLPGLRLAGVDLSKPQIEENRRRFPSAQWFDGNLEEPMDLAGPFDAVVASEVIEHLARPEALLSNASRLAAPGGHLILTTQSGIVRETERRVGHVRHFSARELAGLMERNGWSPVRVWNEGLPFHDLSKWWANRNPDASMSRFGGDEPYGASERAICFALRLAFLLNSRSRGAQLFAVAERKR